MNPSPSDRSSKKALKEEYKLRKFRIGVFQIRNIVNGKIYVEGSLNLDAVWNRHHTQLKFNTHPIERLQQDYNELGESNFKFEVLAEIQQKEDSDTDLKEELKEFEAFFISELQPFDDVGYNRKPRR